MCNPRRVRITATRELDEAWQHEVTRSVQLSSVVTGDARVRQAMGETLGPQALRALEGALANGQPGWEELEGGYRLDVEGGYVVYHVDSQELEIVAVRERQVDVEGTVSSTLTGHLREELSVDAEGQYYDDEWGGHTRERAEREARTSAESGLDDAARRRLEEARGEAEDEAASEIEAEATERARSNLEQAQSEERERLEAEARSHLESVGTRCRQAFHRLLACAYRDAILAYMRRNGGELSREPVDDGTTLDIEFTIQR